MKVGPWLALMLIVAGPAQAQDGAAASVRIDPDSGARVATTLLDAEVKRKSGYSASAQTEIVFWVEVRQEADGVIKATFKGQQLRWVLPKEVGKSGRFGPRVSADPAYVGSPFKKADMTFPWLEVTCVDDSHWCSRVQAIEIVLDADLVRSFVADKAKDSIPISISKKRRIEWRMPKTDLVAALDALGVLAQYRLQP